MPIWWYLRDDIKKIGKNEENKNSKKMKNLKRYILIFNLFISTFYKIAITIVKTFGMILKVNIMFTLLIVFFYIAYNATDVLWFWFLPIGGLWCFIVWRFLKENTKTEREIKNIWSKYCDKSLVLEHYWRTFIWVCFFIIFLLIIFEIFGLPYVPFRGLENKLLDRYITFITIFLFAFLLFYVVEAVSHCISFIERLMNKESTWPDSTIKKYEAQLNIGRPALGCWLKINLIAERTEVVNKIINYPLYVILLIIFSCSTYFDNWFIPTSFYILFGFGILIPIRCAYNLHKEANKAKVETLKTLNEYLINETNGIRPLYGIKYTKGPFVEQFKLLIDNVKQIKKGAFVPLHKQPFVQAILFFLSGLSVVLSQKFYS